MYANWIRFSLSVEYNAEDYGSPDTEWKGEKRRAIQAAKHESINLANLAIWLSKPCDFAFDVLFYVDEFGTENRVRSFQQVRNLEAHRNYARAYLQHDDLTKAHDLHSTLLSLPRDGAVWISVYSIWNALREPEWATRYLLFWITLEALFGPEDGREITFRLSQRIGFFLSQDRSDALTIFEKAKKGYQWRSKVVHGLHLSKLKHDESIQLSFDTEVLGRKSLFKILMTPRLIDEFDNRREHFLDQQIFT